jgi:hypothetical protein
MSGQPEEKNPEVLGYNSVGGGGINNQKMALIGLFATAREAGAALCLPDITLMDQVNHVYDHVPFQSIFNPAKFLAVAQRYGIPVAPYEREKMPQGYDAYFWKTFSIFEDFSFSGHPTDAGFNEFILDLLASFEPLVRQTYIFRKLKADVFEQAGIEMVAQFRIEADWERHCRENLDKHVPQPEDNFLPAVRIVEKILKTFPGTKRLFVICDEPALVMPKEVIRQEVFSRLGVEVFFKSDFLSGYVLDMLKPTQLSLLDFEIASSAKTFVGLSRSTFSNLTALQAYAVTRRPVAHHYIYNAVGPMLAQRTDNGCHANAYQATERTLVG